jgi:hypothetical protein
MFAWVYLLLTFIMLPAFIFYGQAGGLKQVSHGYYNSVFMMGNMGFNKAVCASTYVQLNGNNAALECEIGEMSEIIYAGIVPVTPGYSWENVAYGYCGDPEADEGTSKPEQAPPGTKSCTANYLNTAQLKEDFKNTCTGYNTCDFKAASYLNSAPEEPTEANPDCITDPAKIYMQYKCSEGNSHLDKKREKGLVVSICACIAALIFLVVIFYMKKMAILNFQMWDMRTLTASDFTVEMTVTEALWN